MRALALRQLLAIPVVMAAVLVGGTGCVTLRDDAPSHAGGPTPTARTTVDGDETWDLTGRPDDEAFGIEEDRRAAIYETDEPRTIVLELPEGASVRVEATLLAVERAQGSGRDRYGFSVRLGGLEPEALGHQIRAVLDQLGISADGVDDFVAEVSAAPDAQTERIRYSSPSATFGTLSLGVSANVAPIAGSGRLILGGTWE